LIYVEIKLVITVCLVCAAEFDKEVVGFLIKPFSPSYEY